MKCFAVGLNPDWKKSLVFHFDGIPTKEQAAYLFEVMQRACVCMPKVLEGKGHEPS